MTEQINFITNLTDTNKTIEELLSEGYQGVNYELIENEGFVATANHFADKIQWVKTFPDEDGDIGLMTLDVQAFDELLEFMLDKFGWCPMVYSNKSAQEIHIFTPENELEEMAIELTTEGEYGWKGSLYRLAYVEKYQEKIGLIFATKPEDSKEQDWLLVQIDRKNNQRGWSVHDGSLEQVYYIMAEEIEISEPNYNPTPEQIAEAIKGLSEKEDDLIEFETTGMITAEKAIELLKDYIQAEEENEEEKRKAYCDRLYAQKKANNLEISDFAKYEYDEDEDEYLSFYYYFYELIDLLDLEEATKLHVEIAKELVSNDFEGFYGHKFITFGGPPVMDFEPLVKLWNLTHNSCKKEEEIDYKGMNSWATDAICLSLIATRVFDYSVYEGFAEEFYGESLLLNIVQEFCYQFCGYDDEVGPCFDPVYCVTYLKSIDVLETIIFDLDSIVQNCPIYDLRKIIEEAVQNECSTDKILFFILHIFTCCNRKDLLTIYDYLYCNYGDWKVEDWDSYDESDYDDMSLINEMIEMLDSWEDSDRISLLKGIIEHPNVTSEILEQLTNSEYEEVAEFAKAKLQNIYGNLEGIITDENTIIEIPEE